jgi:hypothetical protein
VSLIIISLDGEVIEEVIEEEEKEEEKEQHQTFEMPELQLEIV